MADDQDNPSWDYKPSGTVTASTADVATIPGGEPYGPKSGSGFSWVASEYIEHERGVGWYLGLIIITAALAAAAYFLGDIFAIVIVVLLGLVVAVTANRKPRQIKYELNSKGVRVADKFYSYGAFRSFSIIRQGPISSVEFMPTKKISFPIEAYFGPGDEERIMTVIGQHLPYEERKMATVDRISRKLRF